MEHVVRLRERAKDAFQASYGVKLTYMPFVTRATVEALLAVPAGELASSAARTIVTPQFVNMGIAVSYDEGLIVPVVKGADTMNTVGIARAINDLAARARSQQLQPDEVQGATFTITNPGPFGSLLSVPIINQPNTGILALDAIEKRPVVVRRRDRDPPHGLHLDVVGPPADRRRARVAVPRAGEAEPRDLGLRRGPRAVTECRPALAAHAAGTRRLRRRERGDARARRPPPGRRDPRHRDPARAPAGVHRRPPRAAGRAPVGRGDRASARRGASAGSTAAVRSRSTAPGSSSATRSSSSGRRRTPRRTCGGWRRS